MNLKEDWRRPLSSIESSRTRRRVGKGSRTGKLRGKRVSYGRIEKTMRGESNPQGGRIKLVRLLVTRWSPALGAGIFIPNRCEVSLNGTVTAHFHPQYGSPFLRHPDQHSHCHPWLSGVSPSHQVLRGGQAVFLPFLRRSCGIPLVVYATSFSP